MQRIETLDTTLRDGAQSEGVVFSLSDKIKVVRALDDMGVDLIEAGDPGSNPKDRELFSWYASRSNALSHAKLCAFCMTARPGTDPADSPSLCAVPLCSAPAASVVGKSSLMQVREVLRADPEENLSTIESSVRFLAEKGIFVLFDAEHYFDGYRDDPEYAISSVRAAMRGGAARIVLCDTNGGTLPEEIGRVVTETIARTGCRAGIHLHNDTGLATAGAMQAVSNGASHVQGTINGYGERCGNTNLCELLPNLTLKLHIPTLPPDRFPLLARTAHLVSEIANLRLESRMPYVGSSAFTHKAGLHIDGVQKSPAAFEHIDPALVGNQRRYLMSELAGRSALLPRIQAIDPSLDRNSPETARILAEIKSLEARGYSFEDSDGSLTLRILSALGRRPEFFRVLDFHVVSRKPESAKNAQAYVKVAVDDREEITADEGDGPVNALDLALRKALSRFYPVLGKMRLTDFKVRVVDSGGTASAVRVHIESTDGETAIGTVGVSTNIIEASFIALTDSIDCLLMRGAHGS